MPINFLQSMFGGGVGIQDPNDQVVDPSVMMGGANQGQPAAPPTTMLESYAQTPEARLVAQREALEEQMSKMSEFLTANPQDSLNEALAANKPKTKKGKVLGVIGEVLAGLARAPESPGMQRDRQTRADWKMNYDNRQQNIGSELQIARQKAGMIDAESKDVFARHKLKVQELAQQQGISVKEAELKLKETYNKEKITVQREKIAAQIDQAKTSADIQRARNEIAKSGLDPKNFEQTMAKAYREGKISLKEWQDYNKSIRARPALPKTVIPTVTTVTDDGKGTKTTVKEPYTGQSGSIKAKGRSRLDAITVN
jgi:hypothetical protein